MRKKFNYFNPIVFALGSFAGFNINKAYKLESGTLQTCFTPGQNCTTFIIEAIDQAHAKIHVQAYGFTSLPIAQALVRAAERGVKVNILLDKSNHNNENPATALLKTNQNIKINIDFLPGIAHNKVMIIDDVLITGSFNFTYSAQKRNAENVLKIHDAKIARKYLNNWHARYAKAS